MDLSHARIGENNNSDHSFPQGAAWLLERLKGYELQLNEKQLIKSLNWVGLTAILSNEIAVLKHRLQILNTTDAEKLPELLQQAKLKMMSLIIETRREIQIELATEFNLPHNESIKKFESSLNYHQKKHFHERVHHCIDQKKNSQDYVQFQKLVDVLSLLETLDLYHTADHHAQVKQTTKTKLYCGFTTPFVVPSRLLNHGGLTEVKQFSGYYSRDELLIYFRSLRKTLKEILRINEPFALTLNNATHSLAIGIVENEWIIMDFKALDFAPVKDDHEAANKVFLSLAYPHAHSLFISTKIYAAKKNLPLVENSLAVWSGMPEFMLIHK